MFSVPKQLVICKVAQRDFSDFILIFVWFCLFHFDWDSSGCLWMLYVVKNELELFIFLPPE